MGNKIAKSTSESKHHNHLNSEVDDDADDPSQGNNIFPDDICVLILSFLSYRTILNKGILISKSWFRITKKYAKLYVRAPSRDLKNFPQSQFLGNIVKLACFNVPVTIFDYIHLMPQLTELFFKGQLTKYDYEKIITFKQLKSFRSLWIWIYDPKSIPLLSSMDNLQFLELSDNNLHNEHISPILEMKNLTNLSLSRNWFYEEKVVKDLAKLTNLKTLNISSNEIGNEGAKILSKMTHLTCLQASRIHIDKEGLIHICKMKQLKSLELKFNDLDCDSAQLIRNSHFPELTYLDLSGNNIECRGAIEICKMNSSILVYLDVSDNHIFEEGILAISQMKNVKLLKFSNQRRLEEGGGEVKYHIDSWMFLK